MPEIYISCPKCSRDERDVIAHYTWWEGGEYVARCANCHDVGPVAEKMKRRPVVLKATRGHQEKRV